MYSTDIEKEIEELKSLRAASEAAAEKYPGGDAAWWDEQVQPLMDAAYDAGRMMALIELMKARLDKLEHEYITTRGLWCVDQNPADRSYEWVKENAFQLENCL